MTTVIGSENNGWASATMVDGKQLTAQETKLVGDVTNPMLGEKKYWGNTRAPGNVWIGELPPTQEQVDEAVAGKVFGPGIPYNVTTPEYVREMNRQESIQANVVSPPTNVPDPINPGHYTNHPSGVDCADITEHFSFCIGNVIKYVWRAGLKSRDHIEDLKKARWYLDREISRLEKNKSGI